MGCTGSKSTNSHRSAHVQNEQTAQTICLMDSNELMKVPNQEYSKDKKLIRDQILPEILELIKYDEVCDRNQSIENDHLLHVVSNHTDVFLSHDWGEGKLNHNIVAGINNYFRSRELITWFDEEKMEGNIQEKMANGIDNATCVIIFVTKNYLLKLNGDNAGDSCKLEFNYAALRKTSRNMIAVVLEPEMRNTAKWSGQLGLILGNSLFIDMSTTSLRQSNMHEVYDRVLKIIDCPVRQLIKKQMEYVTGDIATLGHFKVNLGRYEYSYTGDTQIFTVPQAVRLIKVTIYGASGGEGFYQNNPGGLGGMISGTIKVEGGQSFYLTIGGQGFSSLGQTNKNEGGFNGGGSGTYGGGGGGGATDIRTISNTLTNRILVAGGGGGAGGGGNTLGGSGGGQIAMSGLNDKSCGGSGGTQTVAGAGGYSEEHNRRGCDGQFGVGGDADGTTAGGGGGGYYGGGGGAWYFGGGGGSNYANDGIVVVLESQQGVHSGHGNIIIEVL